MTKEKKIQLKRAPNLLKIPIRKKKSKKKEEKEKDSGSGKEGRDPSGIKRNQGKNGSIYIINKKERYDSFNGLIKRARRLL